MSHIHQNGSRIEELTRKARRQQNRRFCSCTMVSFAVWLKCLLAQWCSFNTSSTYSRCIMNFSWRRVRRFSQWYDSCRAVAFAWYLLNCQSTCYFDKVFLKGFLLKWVCLVFGMNFVTLISLTLTKESYISPLDSSRLTLSAHIPFCSCYYKE